MKTALFVPALIMLRFCASWCGVAAAQEFDERFSDWPLQLKINGRLILADSDTAFESIRMCMGNLSEDAKLELRCPQKLWESLRETYTQIGFDVCAADSTDASDHDDSEILAWYSTEDDLPDVQSFRKSMEALEAGKTLIMVGPHIRYAGRFSIEVGDNKIHHPSVRTGGNLMTDCVLDIQFDDSMVRRGKLLSVLASQQPCVGVGLSKQTALLLDGRTVRVFGPGKATFLLMADEFHPLRIESIVERTADVRPQEWLFDLTEWRRDAMDRTLDRFPALHPRKPHVDSGTLFIVGGGGLPEGLMDDFIEASGGKEKAQLVYVPCSERESVSERQSMVESWRKRGIRHASFVHTKDRNRANTDEAFLQPLKTATGIWFGGGRQWNFADSYYGTTAHKLMKQVLHRGGAIGGSSAGASIQARYLARATPIENFRIMAPGYERGGLGFISGVAIDQHFSQRGRQKDMTQLVNRYPQLLGIGIDERTALIVKKSVGRVIGEGQVHFYDRNRPVFPDRDDFTALSAGQSYDLSEREVIDDVQ